MPTATHTADVPSQPAPPSERPARRMPERIAAIFPIVIVLAGYGRHLAQTLERRAVARGFATIARFFGTASTGTIQAHIQRGLMRVVALQAMLLHRAEHGPDLPAPRAASERAPRVDADDAAAPTPPVALTAEPDP